MIGMILGYQAPLEPFVFKQVQSSRLGVRGSMILCVVTTRMKHLKRAL